MLSGFVGCCLLVVAWRNGRVFVGGRPYIECVFDNELGGLDLVGLDAAGTLAAAEANEHAVIAAEIRRLLLAAHWADLHPGGAVAERRLPGTERAIRLGGEGTPPRSVISRRRSWGVCCACRTAPRAG